MSKKRNSARNRPAVGQAEQSPAPKPQDGGAAVMRPPQRGAVANAPVASPGWSQDVLLAAAFVVVITLIAYYPAIIAKYIWDDNFYVTENMTLRNLQGLADIWLKPTATPQYYPIVHTTFWLEYRLWGLNPMGFHLVNILVHAASAILFWRLLRRLAVPGAWLGGAILAVHPVHVETVAWITEHKNVLSLLFYMLSAHVWLDFSHLDRPEGEVLPPPRRNQPKPPGPYESWPLYALSFGLFLAALLSKTVTCSLPAAILLVTYWKRGRITMREVKLLIPFFIIGAGLGIFTAHMEKEHVGAEGKEWDLSLVERILLAGRIIWFYAGKLAWPNPLIFFYPRWEVNTAVWWQFLFPGGVLGVIAALWALRNRIGRGPLIAVLVFCGTLVPALGFFDVYPMRYSWVADHFQYHASIGLIGLFAAVVGLGWRKLVTKPLPAGAVMAASLVLLVPLSAQTWRQSLAYKDAETLWHDTIAKHPGAWMAHNNLARIYDNRGETDKAFESYKEAVRLNPEDGVLRYNLGNIMRSKGLKDEALEQYKEGERLRPDFAGGHLAYGQALYEKNQVDEAIDQYKKAIAIKNPFAKAHASLALAYTKQGKLPEAEAAYKESLKSPAADAPIYFNYGNLLERMGKPGEAVAMYKTAVKMNPNMQNAVNRLNALEKGTTATAVVMPRKTPMPRKPAGATSGPLLLAPRK
ncbi:MAG: tetratricopeptide repeat protein [Candidatus Sumerlaeaceae bacterium]|nr:tetratricopeptide repeat protein [Candidatus Sumerlaeaceae bacterium]